MRKKLSRGILAALLLCVFILNALVLPPTAWGRTYPGDQTPAENYQVGERDVFSERLLHSMYLPVNYALTKRAGEELARDTDDTLNVGQTLKDMETRYGKITSSLVWLNWPADSYIFVNAPKSGGINFLSKWATNGATSVLNFFANMIFAVTKIFVSLGNNIVFFAFNADWAKQSIGWISETVKGLASPISGEDGFPYARVVFIILLSVLAVQVVLWMLRGQYMKSLSSVLIAVMCVAGTLIYAAESDRIIGSTLDFTDSLAGISMSAAALLAPEDLVGDTGTENMTTVDRGIISITNSAWVTMVMSPWGWGQFGANDASSLKITPEEWAKIKKLTDDIEGGTPPSGFGKRLTIPELDAASKKPGLYADTLFLGGDDDFRDNVLVALADMKINHGNHVKTVVTCAPSTLSAWNHLTAAFWSVLPATAYIVFCCVIALPIILAQVALVILAIFLPLGVMLGLAGDVGVAMMMKYFRWVIAALSVKVGYGLYFGVVMFLVCAVSRGLMG